MSATPREPHCPPYQGDHEPRITLREHLEAQVENVWEKVQIEFAGRDTALSELKRTTAEWKATQNEWNEAVRGVGEETAAKCREYTDQKDAATREYVDEKFKAGRALTFSLAASATGFLTVALIALGLLLGTR
jgi:hypothetical protein